MIYFESMKELYILHIIVIRCGRNIGMFHITILHQNFQICEKNYIQFLILKNNNFNPPPPLSLYIYILCSMFKPNTKSTSKNIDLYR